MSREHKDEHVIVKDFKDSFSKEMNALNKEQSETVLDTFEGQFSKGFEHVKGNRYKLGHKQTILKFIHEAKININYARKNDVKTNFPKYTDNLGYGLGILLGVIEYGLFRNQWKEEANTFSEHIVSTIRLLDRAEHNNHHRKIKKRVKNIVGNNETTPEEQQLGADIIDAFK